MSAPVDLHDWLAARAEALRRRLPGVSHLSVDLWESGVSLTLDIGGATYGLRFRPLGPENAWALTRSIAVLVELGGASSLPRSVEAILRAVVRVVEQIDHGNLVLRHRDRPVEHSAEVERDGAVAVRPPKDLDLVGLACVADTCAMTQTWGLRGAVVTRFDDRLGADGWAAWVDELAAAPPEAVHLLVPGLPSDPALAALVARLRAVGVQQVRLAPQPLQGAAAEAFAPLRPDALLLDVDEAAEPHVRRALVLDRQGLERLATVEGTVLGLAPNWSAPDLTDLPDPAELNEALTCAAGRGVDLAVVGLPDCVAPSVPRASEPLAEVLLAPLGTVHTPVCALCPLQERCPGVDRAAWARWGMRGLMPQLGESPVS